MKRIFCLILCAVTLLLLTACGQQNSDVTVAEAGYTCNALVNYGESFSANVFIKVVGGGLLTITVKTPEELDGLTYNFDNSNMTVSYGELESETLNISDEYAGFASLLNGVFLKLSTGSPIAKFNGEAYIYEGQSDLYKFTVTLNRSGFPTALSMPEAKLSATFNGWMY